MSDDFTQELEYLRHTPAEQILGNHILVLLQLIAVHLASTPPNFEAARLVLDTVEAMIVVGGERLGEHIDLYRTALEEVRQAYARTVSAAS